MNPTTPLIAPSTLLILMIITLFFLGVGTFITGILILATRATGKEVKALTIQTTRLAQKGIAEDITGLVGNATNLVEAVNQLVRTTAGIGILLTLLGLVLIAAACWLAIQMNGVI